MGNHDSNTKLIIPVLIYHEIFDDIASKKLCMKTMGPSCALSKAKFSEQLSVLSEFRIRACSFNSMQLNNCYINNENARSIIITFDDGHIGNYKYAFPLLAENNMTAVFFVTTDKISKHNMMTWRQLKEMSSYGMSIQSHGVTHNPFETLSENQLRTELILSKKIIEDKIGTLVDTISLPHGSLHKDTVNIAQEVGYAHICSSFIDYFVPQNTIIVPRIPVFESLNSKHFIDIITTNSMLVYRWKIRQKILLLIRKIVGINNYRKVYRFIHRIDTQSIKSK